MLFNLYLYNEEKRDFAAGFEARMQPSEDTCSVLGTLGTTIAGIAEMIPKTFGMIGPLLTALSDSDFVAARELARSISDGMKKAQASQEPSPIDNTLIDLKGLHGDPLDSAFGLIISSALVLLLKNTPQSTEPNTLKTLDAAVDHVLAHAREFQEA